jgi:hypothetical protein
MLSGVATRAEVAADGIPAVLAGASGPSSAGRLPREQAAAATETTMAKAADEGTAARVIG